MSIRRSVIVYLSRFNKQLTTEEINSIYMRIILLKSGTILSTPSQEIVLVGLHNRHRYE
jgi:hypothetical protein